MSTGLIGGPANQGDPQLVEDLINQENVTWKEHGLKDLFEEQIVNEILTIPLSKNVGEDRLI